MLRPLVKWYGGKWYHKNWVIEHLPEDYEDLLFISTCLGGGSVELNKKRSVQEIWNDIDNDLINLYEVVRDNSDHFKDRLRYFAYSETAFKHAQDKIKTATDNIDRAIYKYIIHRMSRSGAGKSFCQACNRKRGRVQEDLNAWNSSILQLYKISYRIKNVLFYSKSLVDIIKSWYKDPNVIFYIDPPYLPSTRTVRKVYNFEMTYEQHEEMLKLITEPCVQAKFLISGYDNQMYNDYLYKWGTIRKTCVNRASQTKTLSTRQEVLWRNYD